MLLNSRYANAKVEMVNRDTELVSKVGETLWLERCFFLHTDVANVLPIRVYRSVFPKSRGQAALFQKSRSTGRLSFD